MRKFYTQRRSLALEEWLVVLLIAGLFVAVAMSTTGTPGWVLWIRGGQ